MANRYARLQKLAIHDLNVISFQSFGGLSEKAYNTPPPSLSSNTHTHTHTYTQEIIPEKFLDWPQADTTQNRTLLLGGSTDNL